MHMDVEDQDPHGGSPEAEHVADPTPAPGTTPDWDTDDNPWKQRFESFRPEADRRNTRLSQFEQAVEDFQSGDPAEMRRAAAILGIADHLEIPDPEPEYETDDRTAEIEARFEARLAERDQRDAERFVRREVDERLSKLDGLDEDDRDLVLAQAIRMPTITVDGLDVPDVDAAYKVLAARDQARIKKYEEDWKRGKRAPSSIQPGTTATQQKSITEMVDSNGTLNREGLEWAAQRMADRA
jgi:hypothetical protein